MMRFFPIVLLLIFSGCGFLDDDIFLDDEQYEKKIASQSFNLEGMSIYGSGSGGSYRFGHRVRYRSGHGSSTRQANGSPYKVSPKESAPNHEPRESMAKDEDTKTQSRSIRPVDKKHDLRTLL